MPIQKLNPPTSDSALQVTERVGRPPVKAVNEKRTVQQVTNLSAGVNVIIDSGGKYPSIHVSAVSNSRRDQPI